MTDNEIAKAKINKKIERWYNVRLETYIIIYELAKQRFDDIISEVESVTEKTIKMITGLLTIVGFFAGYLINKPILIERNIMLLIISGGLIIIELILLVVVVLPKKVKGKGMSPQFSIVQGLDREEDKSVQQELTYYNAIVALQENIDFMLANNNTRVYIYRITIPYFVILIPYIAAIAVCILS